MEDRGPAGGWRRERNQWLVPTPPHCLSNELLSGHSRPTWVLPLLTPPSWRRCQEKKTKQASSWGIIGPPRYLTHFLEVLGNLRVSCWRVGQPRALTFNTGCSWDFQWMRVSLWSCENLGRQQRQSCRPFPCFPSASVLPAHPLGAGMQEGAWGFHTTHK